MSAAPHAVAELLRRRASGGSRDDGARLALAIEGGGMRGAVSAGMAIAIDELGLTDAFDAVYGASASRARCSSPIPASPPPATPTA